MKKDLKSIFILQFFLIGISSVFAQESNSRVSAELEIRCVPVFRSLYGNLDFFNIKTEKKGSDYIITHKYNNFRTSYSARVNLSSKNQKVNFGLAWRYTRTKNYWKNLFIPDSSRGFLMAENMAYSQ